MGTFQFIVFLASAIVLPWAAIALMNANMRALAKAVLFVVIAVAARYLLLAVWTPEEMWLLWTKTFIAASAFYVAWFAAFWKLIDGSSLRPARPVVSFVAFMAFPALFSFASFGSAFSRRGSFSPVVFWGCWAAWGLLRTALLARMTKLGRVVTAGLAIVLLSFFLAADSDTTVCSYAGSLNDCLRRNVVERWEPIKRSTGKIVAAWDALVDKDRRATANGKVGVGKIVATGNIKAQVAKLRKDLLTVDSRVVLERVTKLDGKIASAKKALSSLREKRGLDPARAEKLDAKISEAESELSALESARADAIATARRELKEIGLDLPEKSPFFTVDLGALIDNAIVAKNIGFVVENLKSLVDAEKGDTEAAKRYYGAYIVMLDVQAECFRQYLNKAATGIWRDGIADVAKDAEAAKKGNEAKAAGDGRSEDEKKAFLHAAGTNEKTLKAAQVYLALLRRHEEIIREKLSATEKRHEIALSFWESVDIASAFGAKAISDMADFEALLELKLPEIAFFDDVAMKAEFDAITQKLMKESPMADCPEVLLGILSRIDRLEGDVSAALRVQTRRSSFEGLCSRYNSLARDAGDALGRSFPARDVGREDFGLSVGIVRPAALQDLSGLAADLKSAVMRGLDAVSNVAGAIPCPKAAGRPCQMHGEINPDRFDVFFAIPFKDPPTCKVACDAMIEWLKKEHGIDEKRIFRADRWTYSGDFVCKICKAIQESRVVVADITGGNANVFFELGLSVGLGKPSILIHDEKATEGKVPSDLLAWEYVPYDGRNPSEKEWLEHSGIVFDGTRQRRRSNQ